MHSYIFQTAYYQFVLSIFYFYIIITFYLIPSIKSLNKKFNSFIILVLDKLYLFKTCIYAFEISYNIHFQLLYLITHFCNQKKYRIRKQYRI